MKSVEDPVNSPFALRVVAVDTSGDGEDVPQHVADVHVEAEGAGSLSVFHQRAGHAYSAGHR